jgi:hypothetical protein
MSLAVQYRAKLKQKGNCALFFTEKTAKKP